MTSTDDMPTYNVAFEDQNARKSLKMLHVLQEFDIEIPEDDRDMTLFVGKRETLEYLIKFFRRYVSEEGFVLEGDYWDGLTFRFRDKGLRKRFCSGAAKLMTTDDFAANFACKCTEKVTTVCRSGMASVRMTLFLNDCCRQLVDKPPISRRASMLYFLLQIYPRLSGIRDSRSRNRRNIPNDSGETYSQSLIRGCPLPPLSKDCRTRPKVGFVYDQENLYRWSKA